MNKSWGIFAGALVIAGFLFWTFVKSWNEMQQDYGKDDLIVFAASSMAYIFEDARADIEKATGVKLVIVEAASSTLARQIAEGAPADVFISADVVWLDYLAESGHFEARPIFFARNRLVLVFFDGFCNIKWAIHPTAPNYIAACSINERLATGDPQTVPLGKYAVESIDFYKWDFPIAPAANARAALALVETGALKGGILFRTDAMSSRMEFQIYEIPAESHTPIIYWAAAVKQSNAEVTENFLNFLQSETFKTILKERGFEVD
ncbi:MAG: molybdate ABC transporter substrate-binding protein [Sphingomonadales bacterium]